MNKILYILLLLIISNSGVSQKVETITIDSKKYRVTIDTISHKIKDVSIIKEVKFYEKLYIGMDIQKDNTEQKILYDITEYSKISFGYDIGRKRFTLGCYLSLGKIQRRKFDIKTIYF